jgi:membrane-associated protease RseP (regulator of RpoE activity)
MQAYPVRIAMLKTMRRIAVPLTLLALAACTTTGPSRPGQPFGGILTSSEDQNALRNLVTQQDRLYRVAGPLLVTNPDLCRASARNLLGFVAKNKYSYSADLADAAQSMFGLDERLQVTGILQGSGAARAGIRKGDRLVAVETSPLPQGPNAERHAAALLAPLVNGRSAIKITVLRNDANMELNVPLTRACAYGVELGNADNVIANNDGRRVLVTRGMLGFVRSDEELAYVLAREMAHNALQHAAKQNMSGTVGDIIDNLTRMHPDLTTMAGSSGVKATSQELDAAADTLALYMVARAGYGIDGARQFWERLAAQYPASVLNGYTAIHPATSFRLAAIAKGTQDVKAKQAAGKPLLP